MDKYENRQSEEEMAKVQSKRRRRRWGSREVNG